MKQHRSHVSTAACFFSSSLPLSGGFRSEQVTQIMSLRMKQSINNLWAASLIPWKTDPINTDQVSAIRDVKAGAVFMLSLCQIEVTLKTELIVMLHTHTHNKIKDIRSKCCPDQKKLSFFFCFYHVFFPPWICTWKENKSFLLSVPERIMIIFFSLDFPQMEKKTLRNFILAKLFFHYKQKKRPKSEKNLSKKHLRTCRLRKGKHTNFSITFFTTLQLQIYRAFYFPALFSSCALIYFIRCF